MVNRVCNPHCAICHLPLLFFTTWFLQQGSNAQSVECATCYFCFSLLATCYCYLLVTGSLLQQSVQYATGYWLVVLVLLVVVGCYACGIWQAGFLTLTLTSQTKLEYVTLTHLLHKQGWLKTSVYLTLVSTHCPDTCTKNICHTYTL